MSATDAAAAAVGDALDGDATVAAAAADCGGGAAGAAAAATAGDGDARDTDAIVVLVIATYCSFLFIFRSLPRRISFSLFSLMHCSCTILGVRCSTAG